MQHTIHRVLRPLSLTLFLSLFVSCGQETADFSSGTKTTVEPQPPLPNQPVVVGEDSVPPQKPENEVTQPEIPVEETPVSLPEPSKPVDTTEPKKPDPEEPKKPEPEPPKSRALTQNFEGIEKSTSKSPDIIFLVDTSASMIWEKEAIEQESEKLVKHLLSYNIKDFQLFMVGDNHNRSKDIRFNFPPEMFEYENFDVVDVSIGSFDSLDIFQKFLKGNVPSKLKVRKDHPQEVIVVSDDNFGSAVFPKTDEEHAANVRGNLKNLDYKNIRFNGIIGLADSKENDHCNISRVGTVYQKLAETQEPKGFIQDLCNNDWGKLLENFADFIVERTLQATFQLEKEINPKIDLVVTVDSKMVDKNDYSVDYSARTITFKKGHIPAKGAPITVTYEEKI